MEQQLGRMQKTLSIRALNTWLRGKRVMRSSSIYRLEAAILPMKEQRLRI